MLFLLISPEFDIVRLGAMLASARRGQCARETHDSSHEQNDEKSRGWFIPRNKAPRLPEITIRTEHDEEMGTVTIRMRGGCTLFHFSVPWPKEAYHSGTHWLPKQCRMALAGRPTPFQHTLDVPSTGAVYLTMTLSKRKWESRMGTLSTELEAILDGNYCISKSGQILRGDKGGPIDFSLL